MGEPRLSPSQRAYLFNRAQFLQGLNERSQSLFDDGYRVAETNCAHRFVVYRPCKEGEKTYVVDALAQTCTCPFYTRQADGERITEDGSILACKHLRGLGSLVRRTRLAHFEAGEAGCGYRLWAHWLATLAERQRRRHAASPPQNALYPDGTPIRFQRQGAGSSEPAPSTVKKGERTDEPV